MAAAAGSPFLLLRRRSLFRGAAEMWAPSLSLPAFCQAGGQAGSGDD